MTPEEKYSIEPLEFFNYHEYLVSGYDPIDPDAATANKSLVVNHFPNVYAAEHKATRIVRIPRVFDTIASSDLIPQFSTHLPGKEPAGIIKEQESHYTPFGTYHNQYYGLTSLTPLSRYIDLTTLVDAISDINKILYDAYNPLSVQTGLESVLDVLTGSLFTSLLGKHTHTKKVLARLDNYIATFNTAHTPVSIISPRRNGFLSLDIQIPAPGPASTSTP